jgi:hypothetical protein
VNVDERDEEPYPVWQRRPISTCEEYTMSAITSICEATARLQQVTLQAALKMQMAQVKQVIVAQQAQQTEALQQSQAALASGTTLDVTA